MRLAPASKSGIQHILLDHSVSEQSNLDPILPYLSTNDVLPESEVARVKENLRIWNEELSRLNTDTHSSRLFMINGSPPNQIERLTQRDSLRAKIIAYSGCISSVRQIPREIWEQILILCIDETPSISARGSPLSLGAVSRLWREVVINTRYLWSKIHIPISSSDIDRDQELGDIVELWLSRSRGLPLSVSVVVNMATPGATDMTVTTLLAALIKFSEFWESIHLEIPLDYLSSTLLSTLKAKDLPILRSVLIFPSRGTLSDGASHWTNHWTNHVVQTLPSWSIFKAPDLQRLHCFYSIVTRNLRDKWSQITDLRVESCYIAGEDCYEILSGCKNLQTCFLDNCDRYSLTSVVNLNNVGQFRSVRLKHLTSLVLYEKTLLPICFDVPNLQSFEYQGFFIRNRPSLIPHLLRSAQDLESLRVDPGGVDLKELLVLTPSIKRLVFAKPSLKYPALHTMFTRGTNQGVTNDVIRRLTPNDAPLVTSHMPNHGYLCPALESLVCKEDAQRTFTASVLLTCIQKRKQQSLITGGNAAELKEVLIYSRPTSAAQNPVPPATNPVLPAKGGTSITEELLKLVKGGTKIHLPDYNLMLD